MNIGVCPYCMRQAPMMAVNAMGQEFCSERCMIMHQQEREENLRGFIEQPYEPEHPNCRCALPNFRVIKARESNPNSPSLHLDSDNKWIEEHSAVPQEIWDKLKELSWSHPRAQSINGRITLADIDWLSKIGIRW